MIYLFEGNFGEQHCAKLLFLLLNLPLRRHNNCAAGNYIETIAN
jgi:hypothetical protein